MNPCNPSLLSSISPNIYTNVFSPTMTSISFQKPIFSKFISQTLPWITLQCLFTMCATILTYSKQNKVEKYTDAHKETRWLPFIFSFISLCIMYITTKRKSRMIWFMIFSLSGSFIFAFSLLPYSPEAILNETITVTIIIAGINIYAYACARKNAKLSIASMVLTVILTAVLAICLIGLFYNSSLLDLTIALCYILIYTTYVLWDLGRLYKKDQITNRMFYHSIFPATQIYLDFINIFVHIYRTIIKSNKRRN